jgi:acetyl-CoA carboxylase biotin carboxyl carrier protein
VPESVKKTSDKPQKSPHKKSLNVDASAIKELAHILKETDLTEIEYETEVCRIRVAKHGVPMANVPIPSIAPEPVTVAPAPAAAEVTPPADASDHPGMIKAPMVGTVYLSPQPDADAFVKERSKVKEGDTLLIIEAMKVMNPIRAHKSGEVKKILVSDAEPVEFDHGLMIIE